MELLEGWEAHLKLFQVELILVLVPIISVLLHVSLCQLVHMLASFPKFTCTKYTLHRSIQQAADISRLWAAALVSVFMWQ